MSTQRGIAILGSTGSIGRSTLAVIALHPEAFKVTMLGAHSSWQTIVEQALAFQVETVVLIDEQAAAQARAALAAAGAKTRVESGAQALADAVTGAEVHMVMAAIVGAAGLLPTLAAVRAGKRVLLANKEALVMTGRLLMEEVRRAGAQLIPITTFTGLPTEPQRVRRSSAFVIPGAKRASAPAASNACRRRIVSARSARPWRKFSARPTFSTTTAESRSRASTS